MKFWIESDDADCVDRKRHSEQGTFWKKAHQQQQMTTTTIGINKSRININVLNIIYKNVNKKQFVTND